MTTTKPTTNTDTVKETTPDDGGPQIWTPDKEETPEPTYVQFRIPIKIAGPNGAQIDSFKEYRVLHEHIPAFEKAHGLA